MGKIWKNENHNLNSSVKTTITMMIYDDKEEKEAEEHHEHEQVNVNIHSVASSSQCCCTGGASSSGKITLIKTVNQSMSTSGTHGHKTLTLSTVRTTVQHCACICIKMQNLLGTEKSTFDTLGSTSQSEQVEMSVAAM